MNMQAWDAYQLAAGATKEAKSWWEHTSKKGNDGKAFFVSTAHCSITLTLYGQYSPGSQNYWESPKALNAEIVNVIASDPSIVRRAIEALERKERAALIDAEEHISGIAAQIQRAKNAESKP